MTLTERDPATLLAHPSNWRTHPPAQRSALAKSIERYGWLDPIVVNDATGRIIDGHARVDEAVERGIPLVPVVSVDVSEDEEMRMLASCDRLGEMAEIDHDLLRQLFQSVASASGESPFAFTPEEVAALIADSNIVCVSEGSDEPSPYAHPPTSPQETVCEVVYLSPSDADGVLSMIQDILQREELGTVTEVVMMCLSEAASGVGEVE